MAQTTQHTRFPKRSIEPLQVRQPIEHRQHDSALAHRGADRGNCVVQVIGLAAQQDEIGMAPGASLVGGDDLDGQLRIARRAAPT